MAVVIVDGVQLPMEIDTGATVSLTSKATYNSYWTARSRPKLEPADVSHRTYLREKLSVTGQATVTILGMLVIQGDGSSLLGRSSLYKLRVKVEKLTVYHTHSMISLESVLAKHMELFRGEPKLVKDAKVQIHVAKDCKPGYFKP